MCRADRNCAPDLERIISDGEGPAVVHVSKRRRGHLEDDFNEWLRNRRKPAPGEVAPNLRLARKIGQTL